VHLGNFGEHLGKFSGGLYSAFKQTRWGDFTAHLDKLAEHLGKLAGVIL